MAGGGGGNTTTTTAAIDPDIKRRVLPVLGDVGNAYNRSREIIDPESGTVVQERELAPVADQRRQRGALQQQGQFAQDIAREGLSDAVATDLQNYSGQQTAASQGGLGSARQQRANAAGLADRSLQLRQADLDARRQGFEGVTATAGAERALSQEILDAPHTAASRYFGYLQSAPQSQSTTQSGGGGK